jgi:acetylglutamate kinase
MLPACNKIAKSFQHSRHPQVETLIKSQVIKGGMIPKVRAALEAVAGGAKAARDYESGGD